MSNSTLEARVRRKEARERYKPDPVRCLVIAEAPPSEDRYFYFEDVPSADWLFLGVMKALFPLEFAGYTPDRSPKRKRTLLRRFQAGGYWLLDAIEDPLEDAPKGGPSLVRFIQERSDLLDRLGKLKSGAGLRSHVPLILIKTTVYDGLQPPLKRAGYRVIDKRIPFPASGQQKVFDNSFKEAVARSN